jgi:hypothetical protein
MRKSLLTIVLLAGAVVIYSSCKKNDDNPNNSSIVASWEVSHVTSVISVNSTPPVVDSYDTTYAHNKSYVYTFKSDNTAHFTDYTVSPVVDTTGNYELLPGKVIIKGTFGVADTFDYTIANNVLTLSQISTQQTGGYTATSSFVISLNKL